jgi:hypothetical protein
MRTLAWSVLVAAVSLAVSGCIQQEEKKTAQDEFAPLPANATLAERQAQTMKINAEAARLKAKNDAMRDSMDPQYRAAHLQVEAQVEAEKQATIAKINADADRIEAAMYEWHYETNTEQMTGTQSRLAHLSSLNKLDFGFPYAGGSRGSLMIRQRKTDGLRVLFGISKGQIVCPLSCTVRVRFDEKSPMTFTGTPPQDHSSDSLFLAPASKFVSELAKAKKTLVEVSYYQSGSLVSEFKTEGFVWENKSSR